MSDILNRVELHNPQQARAVLKEHTLPWVGEQLKQGRPLVAGVGVGTAAYLASIVALNADTGKYVWHYQETPGDHWDYTSTQPMILADIKIDGKPRKVILHAPKNGFFFVIDRTNGKFISAKNFVDVNWATGFDANGRPIENPEARGDKPFDSVPGPYGAHNWHPMSFNPQTGLVYLPAQNVPVKVVEDKEWTHNANVPGRPHAALGWNTAFNFDPAPGTKPFGRLLAWDPVKQKEAWRAEYVAPWNGGTLTTAGNLVFQGTADGRFIAYNATTGEKLWEKPVGTGVVAAASTYMIDGKQYVSIAVGWGGVFGIMQRATENLSPGTVYTYVVGSDPFLPAFKSMLPHVMVVTELDEGPRLVGYMVNCTPDEVKIGMKVRVVFRPLTERVTLPVWEPLR